MTEESPEVARRRRDRNRRTQRARQAAFRQLAARHPREYEELLADEYRANDLNRRKP